jgi:arylsulfatase A-like enzyme
VRTDRPNIVLFITDQQRFDTVAALGFGHMTTPHLDRLVREGVAFTNCHVTGASCVPSRASLFNGYYPHVTGILSNGQRWRRTWVERLREAGYRCVNVGKMHTYPYDVDAGFHERYIVENKDRFLEQRWYFDEWDKALAAHGLRKQQRSLYRLRPDYRERLGAFEWELPEKLHSDVFVGDFAAWWLESYPKTEPLFLQVGFPGPHPPYDPVPRYAGPYLERADLPVPTVSAAELAGQPAYLEEKRRHDAEVDHDSVLWNPDRTAAQLRRMRAYYYANVTMIDERIGRILEVLAARGYLENTVIFLTSDHGDCLGDHGLSQKWSMYDAVTRVPLVAWAPGRFPAGRRIDGLCQLFDLAPTILELAGLAPRADYDARTLLPALEGRDWTPRQLVYCEQAGDTNLTGAAYVAMVRSSDWKAVYIQGAADGQLYDLAADPEERRNLWDDARHAERRRLMLDRLRDWLVETNFTTRDWAADAR